MNDRINYKIGIFLLKKKKILSTDTVSSRN